MIEAIGLIVLWSTILGVAIFAILGVISAIFGKVKH